MVTRLSASDASFFRLENSSTPMYVGSLSILRKPRNGLSYETLLATVEQRLPQIPRYRQKVREVTPRPGPAGVGRRPRVRHHLPHPQVGAAVPGQRRAAARTGRAAGVSRARQVAAAVGDVPRRGAGQKPPRHLHQIPPGAGQRDDGAGDRPRHRRPHAEAARRSARTSGSRPASPATPSCSSGPIGEWIARPGRPDGGRALRGHRGRHQLRAAARGGPPVHRRGPNVRAGHRAEQPAEHHGVAQPPVHRGQRQAGGLPQAAGPLRLRRQRRRAGGGRGCAAQLAAVAR